MQTSTASTTARSTPHWALRPGRRVAWRATPSGRHLHVEAQTLDAVLGLALDQLDAKGDLQARAFLASLSAEDQLCAVLAATGQALRVPVCVRGGTNDTFGLSSPGNTMGWLFGTLRGDPDEPAYTGRGARKVLARGEATNKLMRDVVMLNKPPPRDNRYKRSFGTGVTYGSAATLQSYYRHAQLVELSRAIGRLAPARWRGEARELRRINGGYGYWGAIRHSRGQAASIARARRIAAARRIRWQKLQNVTVPNRQREEKFSSQRMSENEHLPASDRPRADAGRGGGGSEPAGTPPPPAYYGALQRLGALPPRPTTPRPAVARPSPAAGGADAEWSQLLARVRVRGSC
jgi:hypothetical protein